MKKKISIGLASFVFGIGAAQASVPAEEIMGNRAVETQPVIKISVAERPSSSITTTGPSRMTVNRGCHVAPDRMQVLCN
ncbi:hypothetical protein [Variovorax sp. IB41]|jgi:hypothetical protein|uniref:hypothetical protein n=1 Tax=Variovorax sp. IB41 TaxID=2779370 RepID=UPI0018E74139|nr:hypothetical protein [Variovorax sp. IB41]MBJ2155110.1 hypothetical protein [Variovorax sp. IB41]